MENLGSWVVLLNTKFQVMYLKTVPIHWMHIVKGWICLIRLVGNIHSLVREKVYYPLHGSGNKLLFLLQSQLKSFFCRVHYFLLKEEEYFEIVFYLLCRGKKQFDAVFGSFFLVYGNINLNIKKIIMIQLKITYILSRLTNLWEITFPKQIIFSNRVIWLGF